MKKILIGFLLLLTANGLYSNAPDSILDILKNTIKEKPFFAEKKEQRINTLKQMRQIKNLSPHQLYDVNEKLLKEYQKYKSDSAIVYGEINLEIAETLKDEKLIYDSKLNLAPLYSTCGLYIEALDLLRSMNPKKMERDMKANYYFAFDLFYNQYVQSNKKYSYYRLSSMYKDSLLSVVDSTSLQYTFAMSQKEIYELNDYPKAEKRLLAKIKNLDATSEDYAMAAYLLGSLYGYQGNTDLQKKYYAKSAINDMKNGVKDHAALHNLAWILFQTGDINFAHTCVESFMEDAIFCNVRYRTIESTNTYPMITGTYQLKEKESKEKLQDYLIIISALSVFLVFTMVYIYRQMKRLSKIRKKLSRTNVQLSDLNSSLQDANTELQEANHLKERYIAYSFDLCSDYINKLEDFKNTLNKKIQTKKIDEIAKMVSSNELISNELKSFYNNFDKMFLGIYPTFVEDFNNLLLKEEQIKLKSEELLSSELRIFALIRLGINDSTRMADYLHYSLSTIYNYRTKIRNKSAVPRDEFENHVMQIGSYRNK